MEKPKEEEGSFFSSVTMQLLVAIQLLG